MNSDTNWEEGNQIMLVCTQPMTLYMQETEDYIKTTGVIRESTILDYKINSQILTAFAYTITVMTEKEFVRSLTFTTTKKMFNTLEYV